MEVSTFSPAAQQIADYIHDDTADRGGRRVGPFVVRFDGASTSPWRNYATPDHGAVPSPAEVDALVEEFTGKGLVPRLEYVPAAAPEVEGALLAAGFAVEGRPPLMACTPTGVHAVPQPAEVEFAALQDDDELLEAAVVQHVAYGEPGTAGEADVARLRAMIARGGVVAGARWVGRRAEGSGDAAGRGGIVAAGLVTPERKGVRELAAVAVAEPFRRQGIAAALTVFLTKATARATGAAAAASETAEPRAVKAVEAPTGRDGETRLVFLEPAGPAEQRIYERCGFAIVGEKLWISRR